jgi:hypothetical protein
MQKQEYNIVHNKPSQKRGTDSEKAIVSTADALSRILYVKWGKRRGMGVIVFSYPTVVREFIINLPEGGDHTLSHILDMWNSE